MSKQKIKKTVNSMLLNCLLVREKIEAGEIKNSRQTDSVLKHLEQLERRASMLRDYLLGGL